MLYCVNFIVNGAFYMNLNKIIERLLEIKETGFISTVYPHDGGVGNTLEELLNVKENNLIVPDIGEIELKAKRMGSSSMLTLTSKAPLPRGSNKDLYNSYSRIAKNDGIRKLYSTVSGSRVNPQGFLIKLDKDKIILKNPKNIKAYWFIEDLFKQLVAKNTKTLLVYAKTKGDKGSTNEKFHYVEAYLLSGLSIEKFLSAIRKGKLKIDIRIGEDKKGKNAGKYHDHGSAIRISKRDFLELFYEYKSLL